ncbi:extensin family protein [Sphingomonas sp. 1P06PA]|uniref:extensin family protein n=1 Tax=Sphingomonas sp. 1P06PA TaxID=554121 RepID=UPI0039A5F28D
MRKLLIGVCLIATACIPAGREPPRQSRPIAQRPTEDPAAVRQCLADLTREGVRFEALPDRQFAGGCSATGSVKLVAIGIPVTNLGAVKCPTARALGRWVRDAVQPAAQNAFGTYVSRIESFGSYACRPVNGIAGNKLSEHGLANAVDISAFQLADGRRVTVKDGWRGEDGATREFLRRLHREGCRRFNVAIGPDANAYHADHLHFDMGRGPYCR